LIRKSRRNIMATREKILLLAQQENEEIENHPFFLPPYETTKGTSSVQQQSMHQVQQQKPKIHPVLAISTIFLNHSEKITEDSTTPVLLTNNPLSIEFSELSNNDISSKLQSIKITNISSNTPFNDKGLPEQYYGRKN
ncbi:hypothetical protein JTB14_009431, partial [Gonioctena quinquepunctata]